MAKNIIVVGAGPGGIEAARTAAQLGASVSLITDGPVGGRAGWHSLLPSKVWLGGAEGHGRSITPERVLGRLQETSTGWNQQQEALLRELGVEIVRGAAEFIDGGRVQVSEGDEQRVLSADHFIVAAGSVPVFPDGLKPDGRRVIAPRFMSQLSQLPETMIVVGAGSTGCEFAHLFSALGVQVTWVVDEFGVLPAYHPDAGRFLKDALVNRGVRLIAGQAASHVERLDDRMVVHMPDGGRLEGDTAFVAVGRKPDLERLRLANAGVRLGEIDSFGRTNAPSVYLVGDAAGAPMVANKAMNQARIAAQHALGRSPEPYDPHSLLLATYTAPEIAQVGDVNSDGLARARVTYDQVLKPWLLPRRDGFVELTYDPASRRLAGGVAAGYHAADVLSSLAVALRYGATVDDLGNTFFAHPTIGELAAAAARTAA